MPTIAPPPSIPKKPTDTIAYRLVTKFAFMPTLLTLAKYDPKYDCLMDRSSCVWLRTYYTIQYLVRYSIYNDKPTYIWCNLLDEYLDKSIAMERLEYLKKSLV